MRDSSGQQMLMVLLGKVAKRHSVYLKAKGFKGTARVRYGANSSSVRVR